MAEGNNDFSQDGKPALGTALELFNQHPPIVAAQFEIWYNKWPKAKWVAQGITIPEIKSNTADISFAGFSIPIIVNTTYGDYELSMDILADEHGLYYEQWRSLVIEYSQDANKGRPILDADANHQGKHYIVVRLINQPNQSREHCWRIHNFKPTSVGEVEMGQDNDSFVTFPVTGVFTHISYTTNAISKNVLGEAVNQGLFNSLKQEANNRALMAAAMAKQAAENYPFPPTALAQMDGFGVQPARTLMSSME